MGRSPWTLCPAPSTCSTRADGNRREQFRLVAVIDDRPGGHATDQQERHRDPADRIPERSDIHRDAGLPRPEPGVAPHPAAIGALLGVVQDAAAQRRDRPGRVVFNRPGQDVVEAGEALGAVDKIGDGLRFRGRDTRRDIDEHHPADQLGRLGGEGNGRHASKGHADDRARLGRQGPNGRRHILGVVLQAERTASPPIRMTVPGEIDGHQRPAERQRHRVPGVGVLGPAVQQDQFRRGVAPDQRAQPPVGSDLHEHAAYDWRAFVGDAELRGVLVEVAELVVVHWRHAPTLRGPLAPLRFEAWKTGRARRAAAIPT